MSTGRGNNAHRYDWDAKVRKLLALADDPATPEKTRDALMAKVTQLIAYKYLDDIRTGPQHSSPARVGDRIINLEEPYALEKGNLLHNIAVPLGCRSVLKRIPVPPQPRSWGHQYLASRQAHLFGFDSDMNRVQLLFTSLLTQASLEWAAVRSTNPNHDFLIGDPYSTFLMGFTSATCQRLDKAQRAVTRHYEQSRTARGPIELALADRTQQVVQRMVEVYPRLAGDPGGKKEGPQGCFCTRSRCRAARIPGRVSDRSRYFTHSMML